MIRGGVLLLVGVGLLGPLPVRAAEEAPGEPAVVPSLTGRSLTG